MGKGAVCTDAAFVEESFGVLCDCFALLKWRMRPQELTVKKRQKEYTVVEGDAFFCITLKENKRTKNKWKEM